MQKSEILPTGSPRSDRRAQCAKLGLMMGQEAPGDMGPMALIGEPSGVPRDLGDIPPRPSHAGR